MMQQTSSQPALTPVMMQQTSSQPALTPVMMQQTSSQPALTPVMMQQTSPQPALTPVMMQQTSSQPALTPVMMQQTSLQPALTPRLSLLHGQRDKRAPTCSLHLLLLCLSMLLERLSAAEQETKAASSTTASTLHLSTAFSTTVDWSTEVPKMPVIYPQPEVVPIPRCSSTVSRNCFLAGSRPMGWKAAHSFCRSRGGFLAGKDELQQLQEVWPPWNVTWLQRNLTWPIGILAWPVRNLSFHELTWTALTRTHGQYQWMSVHPAMGDFVPWSEIPYAWSEECAALHLFSQTFFLSPCHQTLYFYCILRPATPEVNLTGVELRVMANMKIEDGLVRVSENKFPYLSLTCTAHHTLTGEPLQDQPQAFWNKDGVYVSSVTSVQLPVLMHDSTKSWTEEHSHMVLKQGTFWCEAWMSKSEARLISNQVLVTLDGWLVLVLDAHRHLPPYPTRDDAVRHIQHTFTAHFPDFNNYTVDLTSTVMESSGSEDAFVKYRFQVHIPSVGDHFKRVQKLFDNDTQVYKDLFKSNGYLKTSSAALSSYCLKQRVNYENGNQILWPFTAIGKVNPLNYRCEISGNRLQPGHCRWNYTHGATIDFDPFRCKRFEYCPRHYTGVADRICLSYTSPDTWETGFKAIYKNKLQRGILDSFEFHRAERGESSVYEIVKQLLKTMGYNRVWLPVRRIVSWAPLTYMGTGISDFPYSHYEGSHLVNISWAPHHPLPREDCLALDMERNEIFTHSCDIALPFVALLDVYRLKNIRDSNLELNVLKLITDTPACNHGWHSTVLQSNPDVCFKMFMNVGNLTWHEANKFCQERDAQLASPSVGFLDWVFRQYLYNNSVDAVWMNAELVSPGSPGETDSPADMINWKANTDYNLPYSVFSTDGWYKKGESVVLSNVLCQKEPQLVLPTQVKVYKMNDSSLTVCVYVSDEDKVDNLKCFVNGKVTKLRQVSDLECVNVIDSLSQGYYQCHAWMWSPFQFVQSNILINRGFRTLTFAVKLSRVIDYTPRLHDATFIPIAHQELDSIRCVSAFMTKIEKEFKKQGLFFVEIKADNFFHMPNESAQGLYYNFHVEFKLIDDALPMITEWDTFETLAEIFETEGNFSGCILNNITSTHGCVSDVTLDYGITEKNLTWPKTEGSVVVLPKELCVNPKGEPITRECVGDFLVGYYWERPSEACTGHPSNITKQLWEITSTNSSSSPSITTLSTLTANGSSLKPIDIHFVATKFQSLSNEKTLLEHDLEEIVETLNNVMKADAEAFENVQRKLNSSSILFEAFENITFKVKLPENEGDQKLKAFRELVSVERIDLEINSTVIGYKAKVGGHEEETVNIDTKMNLQDSDVAIIFPPNLTWIVASDSGRLAKIQINKKQKIQLTFAVYRNPKLFQDRESFPNYSVNSHIIQATYGGKIINNLKEPIKLIFRPSRQGNDTKCVYWDFKKNAGRGGWSSEGCWMDEPEGNLTVCYCNHLTCFAQLMNYSDDVFEGIHALVLDIITIIGCCLSIVSLLLVFITFFLFKKWRRPLSNKILVNLSFSVFCSIVIFLAGIDQTWNVILCRSVAVALHYFILASFGWMLVEAVHQYLKFVKVVGTYIPRFMWKASVTAWGVPVLPIIVVLVFDSTLYDSGNDYNPDTKICWMSSEGFKYAFLPPLALTMSVNLIMFCLIIYGATCGRVRVTSTMSDKNLFLSQLRMAICVFFLLGFTWIFGILAIWKGRLLFSYLFCIFNTLQGFFIFMFHVFRERSARRLWREFLSVITKNMTSSEQANSQNINNSMQYKGNLNSVTYNQGGEISIHPRRSPLPRVKGSVRSTGTTSTLLQSLGSIKP
ncbi:uncharacterized protein [Cherax quadricarinatus]|uniref:uncharacterized protein isoform X2 n=1 Tax=Cherax quadricarinatus TaxID=27406 RepID=UPI00387E3D11